MNTISKGVLSLAVFAAAAISSADLNYSNVNATITFDGTTTYDLKVDTNGNSIDFSALDMPMYVATANSQYSSAVINISYDVNADKGINGLELVFTGFTFGNGNVGFDETVKDNQGNTLDSVSGLKFGNNAFVESDSLDFGGSYTQYSVEKNFTLNLGLQTSGLTQRASLASVGLIEQNAVPEPATLGAVGVGLFGIMARRRRK